MGMGVAEVIPSIQIPRRRRMLPHGPQLRAEQCVCHVTDEADLSRLLLLLSLA
jgi:hypothetical protein